jgi:putative inorganic carbon (HCO3(-)) transporter
MRSGARGAAAAVPGRFRVTTAFAVATCALVPAYTVRWHLGPLPTTLLEVAILLTVGAFVAESLRDRAKPAWRTDVMLPAIVFLFAGLISVAVAPDYRAALGLYRAYFIEPMAFFVVLINAISSQRRALAIAGGLAIGGAIAGLANSAVVVIALINHTYDVVNTPPVVIYNTANATALYLVPLMAFAGAVVLHRQDRRERLAAGAFLLVGGVCVLLSFSRGGYLALGAVALGLALSHRRRSRLLAGGALVGAALVVIPPIRHRVLTEVNLNDPHNTLVGRSHLWSAALQMLRDHPIFGAGLSGFATAVGPYWNPYHPDRFTYPHNIVLNFWTETGLLGVFAFAGILVVTFARTWRGWRKSNAPEWRAVHLGVMLALVAVLVHGLVDVPYWKNDLSLEFWALLSLTFAPAALTRTSPHSARRILAQGATP